MNLDSRFRWYKISLLGPDTKPKEYIFRGLTANELRKAGLRPDKDVAENFILATCVVNLESLDVELGGTCIQLLNNIYVISGVTEEGRPYQEAATWIESEQGKMEALAISVIPSLTLELLRNCDPADYARYMMLGKFHYESMLGQPAANAFGTVENGLIPPDPVVPPPPGQSARVSEGGFTWTRGR